MKSDKRVHALQIIYNYLDMQHLDRVEVTAADIVGFYKLPPEYSHTLAATMQHAHDGGKRKTTYGFRVTGLRTYKKERYSTKYTIERIKENKS